MSSQAPPLGPVSTHVSAPLAELPDKHRVVVWHDAERAFDALVERLELPQCKESLGRAWSYLQSVKDLIISYGDVDRAVARTLEL